MTMYLPEPKVFVTFSPEGHPQFVAHPTSFVSDKPGPRQSLPASAVTPHRVLASAGLTYQACGSPDRG